MLRPARHAPLGWTSPRLDAGHLTTGVSTANIHLRAGVRNSQSLAKGVVVDGCVAPAGHRERTPTSRHPPAASRVAPDASKHFRNIYE